MPRSALRLGPAITLLAALAAAPLVGCTAGAAGPKTAATAPAVEATSVADADFAKAAAKVLTSSDRSEARRRLLLGVVQRQLEHAAARFDRGEDERGTRAVQGALLLLREGEPSPSLVGAPGGAGDRALAGAIRYVSARGDEGQARALLELRRGSATGDEQAKVAQSLEALDAWARDTRTGSPVEIAGLEERAAVGQALLDPSGPALDRAEEAISQWIAAAIQNRLSYQQTGKRPPPKEAIEATRALGSGPATLVALHLRQGNAAEALAAIERTSVRRIVQPSFYAVVQGAATKADAGRPWRALWGAIEEETGGQVGGDFGMEPALFEAARFHVSLEAWRREAQDPGTALVLAGTLASFGLAEVAPLVVIEALAASEDPAFASATMRLLALALREHANEPDTARRIFGAATEALALAERAALRERVRPSATDVRELMGGVELRAGELAAARPLLEAVARDAPSSGAYLSLALLERQAQNAEAALGWTGRAGSEPYASAEPVAAAEAGVAAYEIHRARAASADAARALEGALRRAVAAQRVAGGAERARALRVLARILDAYGDTRGATRAQERALAEASGNRKLLGATILDGIARAVVRRDLQTGRALLRRAVDERLDGDDLVYAALWVKLLEGAERAPTDGAVTTALDAGRDAAPTSWTGKLARWAVGKLSDDELTELAQSGAQRVEAAFYLAMQRRNAGDAAGEAGLREVAHSGHMDLVEVQLARELLFPPLRLELPKGVALP